MALCRGGLYGRFPPDTAVQIGFTRTACPALGDLSGCRVGRRPMSEVKHSSKAGLRTEWSTTGGGSDQERAAWSGPAVGFFPAAGRSVTSYITRNNISHSTRDTPALSPLLLRCFSVLDFSFPLLNISFHPSHRELLVGRYQGTERFLGCTPWRRQGGFGSSRYGRYCYTLAFERPGSKYTVTADVARLGRYRE